MKTTIIATVIAMTAIPALACETKPIANSNATQFVDPNCNVMVEGSGSMFLGGKAPRETLLDSSGNPVLNKDGTERQIVRGTLATNITNPTTNLIVVGK